MGTNEIEAAVIAVCREMPSRWSEQVRWQRMSEAHLWFELVACILGSQVRFEVAYQAAGNLRRLGLIDTVRHRSGRRQKRLVEAALKRPIRLQETGRIARYRFPESRAEFIRASAAQIYGGGGSLRSHLRVTASPAAARRRIVSLATGVGPKQASLFLTNVGYTDELAILDTHVLRFMSLVGRAQIRPNQLTSVSQYEDAEKIFRAYAENLGVSVAQADAAVWIVARAFRDLR